MVIIICLITITFSIYYGIGGFDPITVYEYGAADRTVVGKHYIGKFPPRRVRNFIKEAKALIDSGRLKGALTLVEFQNDTIGSDSIHLFIGASFDEIRNILEIPSGFSYEEFQTDKVYQVFITQHPLVQPLPNEVKELMQDKATEAGRILQPVIFDIYYEDGSLRTEGWAFEKK
ncbi:MAG: hypothetical protein AAGA66_00220 [Bacteroidota bacterium]